MRELPVSEHDRYLINIARFFEILGSHFQTEERKSPPFPKKREPVAIRLILLFASAHPIVPSEHHPSGQSAS
jgi:hypothetical protein